MGGAASAAVGVPVVELSSPNPFHGPDAAMGLLANAVNDPTFADVVFHFSLDAPDAYGHRLVLGRASEVWRAMLSGPLAEAAQRPDGRLHINLPAFVELAPFIFLLCYLYTGATEDAGRFVGTDLRP